MRRLWWIAAILLTCSAAAAQSAGEIDRLLAAVNGRIVTEGDLRIARPLNAVLSLGRSDTRGSRQVELNRLIDLELVRQELEYFPLEGGDQSRMQAEVLAKLDDFKEAYAEIGGLDALLRQLGLQEAELVAEVRLRMLTDRFIDLRFRPFAAPSELEVEAYYREKLVPVLQKKGSPLPPLGEVSPQISAILTEQKVTADYEAWIANIRNRARIEFFPGSGHLQEGKHP